MGLITLAFLLAFTALYLSKSLEKKPEFVNQAVEKINSNLDKLAVWGAAYAAICVVLTLLMAYSSAGGMLVRLLANLLVVVMALPFAFEQLLPKFEAKLGAKTVEKTRAAIACITKQEKYVGYAGGAISLLLFAVLFS